MPKFKVLRKTQFLNLLATQLGKEWSVDNNFLSYNPTLELFAFMPGGTMTMGFSVSDIFQLCKARGDKYKKEEWSWTPNIQTPALRIGVDGVNEPKYLRICDLTINLAVTLLDTSFSFSVTDSTQYSQQTIDEVIDYLKHNKK